MAGRARPDSDLDVGYYRFRTAESPALDIAVEMRLAKGLRRLRAFAERGLV